ncbi:hypothetical protein [Rheinheimera sp.]|uniref:hypothetical protein n=1 Tax=Rheinheimera sp. TaxID=1869214 RepID=UPI002FDE9732
MRGKVVIVGCGWLGQQLGVSLARIGYQLYGSRQSEQGLLQLPVEITPMLLQLPQLFLSNAQQQIWQDAWVICALPPSAKTRSEEDYLLLLRNVAQLANQAGVRGLIHCSSTGVYQGLAGEVSEKSVLADDAKSRFLRLAEQELQQVNPCVTLRLAGLIGPGRHPARFCSGRVLQGAELPVNMVHAADIAAFIIQLLQQQPATDCFNLCSPEHPTKQQFYTAATQSQGLAAPQFASGSEVARVVSAAYSQSVPGFCYRFSSPVHALPYC